MPENRSSTQTPRSGRLWMSRAAKLVVSLAALVVLCLLSWQVTVVLFEHLPDDKFVLTGLSAVAGTVLGVTISLIKRISLSLGALGQWIAGHGWRGFLSHIVAFCVTLPLTLSFLVFCIALGLELFSDKDSECKAFAPISDDMSLEQKLKKAMEEHGYTTERADLLDRLAMFEATRHPDFQLRPQVSDHV